MRKFKWLKWFRVLISLSYFVLIAFLFLDFTNTFSDSAHSSILYFQFLPSALSFINLINWAATGFLVVTILSFLFGRVYCSFLCPLGTLQDGFHFLSQKFRRKKRRKYKKPLNWIRFPIFLAALVLLLFGSILLLNLLDPYSLFGKITSNLLRPVYYEANNVVSHILENRDIFSWKPVELKHISLLSAGYALLMLALIVWLSVKHGRLYCNTVCPVGTLLGRFSEVSLFKIRLDDAACTSCGICGHNCKADCIDTKGKKVDFSRCIGCLNCLSICPGGGVKFTMSARPRTNNATSAVASAARRDFVKKSVFVPAGLLALSKSVFTQEVTGLKKGMVPVVRKYPVTAPGTGSIEHFNKFCTACGLCVSACPTQVLQPSFFEYGLAGMMQPRMDFITSFCNFECIICTGVCPTGAILPLSQEAKKLTQIGKSKFVKENCVVYTDETACGACSEHCPTKAVNMVPYDKKPQLAIPEVNEDICIGCGACEYACPTDPKSIYVEGNPVHVLAQKPVEKEVNENEKTLDEFPF